jgi:hypothetical protein
VRVTDGVVNTDASINITVNEVNVAPVMTNPGNRTVAWGNALSFTLSATDADIPANVLAYSISAGSLTGMSLNSSTGGFSWTPTSDQVGTPTVTFRVTDDGTGNLYDEETITITVGKRATTLVYSGDASKQYSDPAALKATLTDNGGGSLQETPISGKSVSFTLGSQSTSATTNSSGLAQIDLILTQAPGSYTVDSSFAGDDLYLPSSDSDPFTITKEDARVDYTGLLYVCTPSISATSAEVTLRATILDITAVSGDPASDPDGGDISNANVTFYVNGDNEGTFPVELVMVGNTLVGSASTKVTLAIGDYDIDIVVNGYYTRSERSAAIEVVAPTPNSISGGGYLTLTASNGQYPGQNGTKTNFGFNIKYNKNLKNVQGHVNIIFRNAGHVYQIKTTATDTLAVDPKDPNALKASFTSKATLTDVTNPLAPINLGGGYQVQIAVTDRGEPGNQDSIAITLWNGNKLLFSSNWNGIKTIEQVLDGGNLQVRGS